MQKNINFHLISEFEIEWKEMIFSLFLKIDQPLNCSCCFLIQLLLQMLNLENITPEESTL